MKRIESFTINILPIIIGVIFLLFNIFYFAGETTLGADIVSRVLPAVSSRLNIGVPYTDYWEITPPGHYIILNSWAEFFGFTGLSVKILHIVVGILLVFFIFKILKKVLRGGYLFISSILVYFLLFSTRLTTFILPAEILALAFSVLGLYALMYIKNYNLSLMVSSFLFIFSGQIKDPYIFSILAIVPVLLFELLEKKKRFIKSVIFSILGILIALAVNLVYLISTNSLESYVEVLNYKSLAFEVFDFNWLSEHYLIHLNFAKEVFFYFDYPLLLPIVIFILVKIYFKNKNKLMLISSKKGILGKVLKIKFDINIQKTNSWLLAWFCLGLSIGFVIQRSLGSHYYIVGVTPLVVFPALCFNQLSAAFQNHKESKITNVFLFIIFIMFMIPNKAYVVDYHFERLLDLRFIPKLMIWSNNNLNIPMLVKINENTSQSDCILDLYGWGVGTTYLYTERKPCTRFFIPNIVNQDWQRKLYKENIIDNNPRVIIYRTTSSDMDFNRFEDTVINFPKIIRNCYLKDSEFEYLYWSKMKDEVLRECIKINSGE